LHVWWQMFPDICACGASIYGLIGIPVGTMTNSLATTPTTLFSTVTYLLMIGSLAITTIHVSGLLKNTRFQLQRHPHTTFKCPDKSA